MQSASKEIMIKVDPETAKAYDALSPEEKKKMQILLNLRLKRGMKETFPKDLSRLEKIVQQARKEAEAGGLTPEILEDILND